MVDHLDLIDGDPDFEDGGDAEWLNEDGTAATFAILPSYGVDQSRGPINEEDAHRAYMRTQMRIV
jgi:hypothetical protein